MRLLLGVLSIALGLGLAVVGLRYPVPYRAPDSLPELAAMESHRLFVHGTLRSGLLRWVITGQYLAADTAVLADFERNGLDVRERKGAQVTGLVLSLDGAALARLDRYERLGDRYQRVCLLMADGHPAWVYRRIVEAEARDTILLPTRCPTGKRY